MTNETDWPGLQVLVPEDLADVAEEQLASRMPDGSVLGMARTVWTAGKALHAPPTNSHTPRNVRIHVYLDREADLAQCVERAEEILAACIPDDGDFHRRRVLPRTIPDEDWAVRWKRFFRPVRVTDRLAVLPAWEDPETALRRLGIFHPSPIAVRIDPGMAFGSGSHPTTRLCLALLEQALDANPKARVLDFGTGSGILSFAAVLLEAGSVVAIEKDEAAQENFETNAELNGVRNRIDHRIGSSESIASEERFDIIVCNALLDRVSEHFENLSRVLDSGGAFVYSGFLESQEQEVEAIFAKLGLEPRCRTREEEWVAAVFERTDAG